MRMCIRYELTYPTYPTYPTRDVFYLHKCRKSSILCKHKKRLPNNFTLSGSLLIKIAERNFSRRSYRNGYPRRLHRASGGGQAQSLPSSEDRRDSTRYLPEHRVA